MLIFRVLAATAVCLAVPTHRSDIDADDQFYTQTKDWLIKYGYLQVPSEGVAITADQFNQALYDMRTFYNISNTAVPRNNQDLRRALKMARCGFPDTREGIIRYHGGDVDNSVENVATNTRGKRYTLQGSKWDNSHPLTYRFTHFTEDMETEVQKAAFKHAVEAWTSVANIVIVEGSPDSEFDIEVFFATYLHLDMYPFDGNGGILAHAFYPEHPVLAGDIHFDDDEKFSVTEEHGAVDFFFVALHELGHVLGLHHSTNSNAIMFPSYQGFQENVALHRDDIEGIQRLYGTREGYESSTSDLDPGPLVAEENDGHSCTIIYDAIVNTGSKIYFFKDNTVWQTDTDFEPESYPSKIHSLWEGGPDKVDAAFVKPDKSVVLFSGNNRWEYYSNSYRLRPGYPRDNSDLGGLPESVEDAVYVQHFHKVLVFKDQMYWTLDPQSLQVQSGGLNVASLDIPLSINSVFYKDGQLFVLADRTNYYVYEFAPSFQRLLGYPKDFNVEKAGKLCGWCQTYSADGYNGTDKLKQINSWLVWSLLCAILLTYYFQ